MPDDNLIPFPGPPVPARPAPPVLLDDPARRLAEALPALREVAAGILSLARSGEGLDLSAVDVMRRQLMLLESLLVRCREALDAPEGP